MLSSERKTFPTHQRLNVDAQTPWPTRTFHNLPRSSSHEWPANSYFLKQALRPAGHVIIAAFAIGGPDKCSGLDIVQYDTDKLVAELGDGFALIETRDEVHITPANKQQKFTYFRFVRTSAMV